MSAVKSEPQEEYHHWDDVHNVAHPVENHAKPFIGEEMFWVFGERGLVVFK